jgi:prolipoprotein diacylglyceryl transferase
MSNSIGVETPTARPLFRSARPSGRAITGTRGQPVRRQALSPRMGIRPECGRFGPGFGGHAAAWHRCTVTPLSIPSPRNGAIALGPLELRAYGLMIALDVLAAVALARRRWSARGGNPDDITAIAMWAVPAGLVGARLYHVATDWHRFEGRWWHTLAIWEGGLGIPGGLVGGVVAGVWVARRRGLPVAPLLDVAAPAILVAQAIGRFGNWFNQELFGRPTGLPWGLEIDPAHRPPDFADVATFHPTFLYEATWNLALAAVLIAVERRWHPPPGSSSSATSPAIPPGGSGSSHCASIPPPRCSACG